MPERRRLAKRIYGNLVWKKVDEGNREDRNNHRNSLQGKADSILCFGYLTAETGTQPVHRNRPTGADDGRANTVTI